MTRNMRKEFVKERDETMKSYDLAKFKEFYNKWRKRGIYTQPMPRDEVIEISMRKCVCHLASATSEEKMDAMAWLTERGYTDSIGGLNVGRNYL